MHYTYFGTSEFAAIILEKLIKAGMAPVAVVTQPDRPAGREKTLQEPPVKTIAKKNNIPLLQPERLNDDAIKIIGAYNADLFIVAAYGRILPKKLLTLPRYQTINVHPSLLPKYRGPSPIQTIILNGDTETGVTLILLDKEIDHGPVLKSSKFKIQSSKTAPKLEQELANMGAELLIKTIPDWIVGKITPMPQDHAKATFTKMLTKEDGKIDWTKSAEEIERQIRAFTPWPGTWTMFEKRRLKILAAEVLKDDTNKTPGTVSEHPRGLSITCKRGCLLPTLLQLEGKKSCDASTFLRGHKIIISTRLS